MQIIIKSRHTVLPKRLREFATTKFEHLEKILDRIQTIEIAVGESGARKVADKSVVEVTLVTKLRRLHAEAHGPDVMTAVEAAVNKVEAQVRRIKGKAIARTRRSGGHIQADRLAADIAMNGAADAPTRVSRKAAVERSKPASAAKRKMSGKSAAKTSSAGRAAARGGSKASGVGRSGAAARKTAAARKPPAPRKATSVRKASSGRTSSPKRNAGARRTG
jgi:ribosomal subunit interface protein